MKHTKTTFVFTPEFGREDKRGLVCFILAAFQVCIQYRIQAAVPAFKPIRGILLTLGATWLTQSPVGEWRCSSGPDCSVSCRAGSCPDCSRVACPLFGTMLSELLSRCPVRCSPVARHCGLSSTTGCRPRSSPRSSGTLLSRLLGELLPELPRVAPTIASPVLGRYGPNIDTVTVTTRSSPSQLLGLAISRLGATRARFRRLTVSAGTL